jgi:hypothetical protein
MITHIVRYSMLLLCAAILAGCVCAQAKNTAEGNVAQIIVKFKPSVTNPNTPAFLKDLSRTACGEIAYFRAMSGDAHVLRLSGLKTEADVNKALKRLAQRPDVEYAELDRKLMPLQQGDQ